MCCFSVAAVVFAISTASCASPRNSAISTEFSENKDDLSASSAMMNGLNELDVSNEYRPPRFCKMPATCQPLNYTTCFGVKLPYAGTTLSLVPGGVTSQEQVRDKLQKWRNLMQIPKCWAVIQPYLCALYMPKCENGLEMCEIIQSPCRVLKHDDLWPEEFKCNRSLEYKCKNTVRELKFNTTGACKAPLVEVELGQESSYYEGFEGCGVQCHDPFFTNEERQEIRGFLLWVVSLAFLFNSFTIASFLIDWNLCRYPSQAVFFVNFSFLIVSAEYLHQQIWPSAGNRTICHKDGTLRVSEPSIRENLSCVVSFVLTYYFFIAGLVWFVILGYSWKLSCQTAGKTKNEKDKRGPYYHLVAWSLPLVLTIIIMALGEVDGDSLTGVCFVGVVNKHIRAIFLLGPMLCATTGLAFFFWGIYKLIYLKWTSKELISKGPSAFINEVIMRVFLFSTLSLLFGFIIFVCHAYEFQHYASWKESFKKFLICQLGVGGDVESHRCKMEYRPSVLMVQLQFLAQFGINVCMSMWTWNSCAIQAWSRFVCKIMKKEVPGVKVVKHKVIAKAFAKRKMLYDSHISISFTSHEDPVGPMGLNFELQSLTTLNSSTTWAKNLPKFLTRRGALTRFTATGSNSSQRGNSVDSEISYSVRRVSVESRRHSLDSTVAVQALEVTKTVRTKRPHRSRKYKRGKGSRRDSDGGSDCSDVERQINEVFSSLNMECNGPNMKRRPAICGEWPAKNVDALKLEMDELFPAEMTTEGSSSQQDVA